MDGRVPERGHFLGEVAMKIAIFLTVMLFAVLAPFTIRVESSDSTIAHFVFFVT